MILPDAYFEIGEVARWVLLGLLLGAILAAAAWLLLRPTFAAPVFTRSNYRGVELPVGVGIVVVLVTLALHVVLPAMSIDLLPTTAAYALAAIGFGLLGFIDDIAAIGDDKGFAGHLKALRHGRLSTGGLKLCGGAVIALGLAATLDRPGLSGPSGLSSAADHPWRIVPDAALIALSANLGNLFDRAPGRTTKVATVAFLLLWALNLRADLGGAAIVVGAALGLLAFDLRERLMLGDAGANALGAVLGVAVIMSCSFPGPARRARGRPGPQCRQRKGLVLRRHREDRSPPFPRPYGAALAAKTRPPRCGVRVR